MADWVLVERSCSSLLGVRREWLQYADAYVGRRIQPFWIEDEARKLPNTNFTVNSRFRPQPVRDGKLITGQQQYSGTAAARLVIQALGM